MLRCPRCGNTYTDETLRFCLADGTPLVISEPDARSVGREGETVRIPTGARRTEAYRQQPVMPMFFKAVLALVAVAAVVGSIVVVAGLIYYNKSSVRSDTASQTPAVAASATPTPAPELDTDQVIKSIAEIQKMLTEGNDASDWNESSSKPPVPGDTFGTVNSPKDGFLALRVLPVTTPGEPLAKIPNGSTIKISNCLQERTRIGTRSGRWCMTSYEGKTGWVFDAWLDIPNKTSKR